MEEITTRFEIIRLAVQLGDFRTIDLQSEKLRSLSLDDKLNEIIDLLESRNYRQALYEMKHYAQSLEDEFFSQRSRKAPSPTPARKSAPPSDDLGLFAMEEEPEEEDERVLELDEILKLSQERQAPPVEEYRPAPAFEEEREESVSAEPEIGEPEEAPEEEPLSETGGMSLADHLEEGLEASKEPEEKHLTEPLLMEEEPAEEPSAFRDEEWLPEEKEEEEPVVKTATLASPGIGSEESESGSTRYPPISYISQKFRNMIHQFPPVDPEGPVPPEVEEMQGKISREGYTDEEIEEFLRRYQEYKAEGKRTEAAMVLLLAAATESQFAQFLLARELFRGEIIEEDHAEAFTQINTLADQNFAEAICDLGQFYEHGVGIGKDRQMALLLYEEAAEMGVARARKHYERLKNSRGILGVFKNVSLPKVSIPLPKKR